MKNKILLILAVFFCFSSCAEQESMAENPKTGAIAFGEMRSVGNYTRHANALWYDSGYLFCGLSGSIDIYDTRNNPMDPVKVSSVSVKGLVRQMVVNGNYLYAVSRETGAWIIDITDITRPKLSCHYDSIELATGVDVSGNCMFLAERNNGVEFVDITDKEHPEHITIIKTEESQSVFYQDGYLYSGEWHSGTISVFDCRDLSKLKIVNTPELCGYGDGLWAVGDRLYASTGHHHLNSISKEQDGDGHGIEVFNIADRANPKSISRAEFDVFYNIGNDFWMPRPSGKGNTVFCADCWNGAYAVDFTKENRPKIISRITTPNNQAVTSIALGEGVVYLSAGKDGVLAVESSLASPCVNKKGIEPANVSYREPYTLSETSAFAAWQPAKRGIVHGASAWRNCLFVAAGDAGLYVIKKGNDGSLYEHAKGPSAFAGDVKVKGDKLYVAEGLEGLAVYKIAAGPMLTLIARIKNVGPWRDADYAAWVFTPNDNYVVVGTRCHGYSFFAIGGTDGEPTYTYKGYKSITVNYNRTIPDNVCAGDLLPAFTRAGSYWTDLSSKEEVTHTPTSKELVTNWMCGVTNYKNGDVLYNNKGIIYVASPGSFTPKEVSRFDYTNFTGEPRWDGADRVSFANFVDRHVSVVNTTSIANPKVEIKETIPGQPDAGTFWYGKAVFPAGYAGVLVEK